MRYWPSAAVRVERVERVGRVREVREHEGSDAPPPDEQSPAGAPAGCLFRGLTFVGFVAPLGGAELELRWTPDVSHC